MENFTADFNSLQQFQCPEWYKDAKFGIWSHWGPQSVPMFGDWYARHMYIEGTPQYLYHCRTYGHPSEFGYKDICALWKAEKFDPDELMDLYVKAGARYFVAQASHHDNFFNFPSKYNRFNSVELGPQKDICGMWKSAADKQGIPFGLSEHLGMAFNWFHVNKGHDEEGKYAGVPYDGNDPDYKELYFDNYEHVEKETKTYDMHDRWNYTTNEAFRNYWLNTMKELIDLYEPQLLYSDGALPFGDLFSPDQSDEKYSKGLEAVAYLYNSSIAKHGSNQAIYNQKRIEAEIYNTGIIDFERTQVEKPLSEPWQTDTCIGNWFYKVHQEYKKADYVIQLLIDIVSKNGVLLLNVPQYPDGTIDYECRYLLEEMADWFAIFGEAIHGTRPWRLYGEGNSKAKTDRAHREDPVQWQSSDFRFTTKDDCLYAFMMKTPENNVAVIQSLNQGESVKKVSLMGGDSLEFSHEFGILTVKLPNSMPSKYNNCLKISFN